VKTVHFLGDFRLLGIFVCLAGQSGTCLSHPICADRNLCDAGSKGQPSGRDDYIYDNGSAEQPEMLVLFKWTHAIEAYLRTGNAQLLQSIVKEQVPVLDVDWQFIELAERLNNVSMSIETCRGQMVEEAISNALDLLQKLKDNPSSKLKPFQKLLDQIARKLSGFQRGHYE
jgi:hypothetical protein